MPARLFRLDASIQSPSVSRAVADSFQRVWTTVYPDGLITHRDLARAPLPYLSGPDLGQARKTPLDELLAADALLLAVPMYNWTIPATVKTWIDHLMTDPRIRAEKPALSGRPAVIVSSRGGAYGPGTPKEGWDYVEPYLRRVMGQVLGLDVHVIKPELTFAGIDPAMDHLRDAAAESLRQAHAACGSLARRLAEPSHVTT